MKNNICTHQNCDLKLHKNLDKCVLHCHKNDYNTDRNSGLLSEFSKDFKNYILNQLFSYKDMLSNKYNKQTIDTYFNQNNFKDEDINKVLKEQIIIPSNLIFRKFKLFSNLQV